MFEFSISGLKVFKIAHQTLWWRHGKNYLRRAIDENLLQCNDLSHSCGQIVALHELVPKCADNVQVDP
ncbi:hypothetical protein ACN9M1_11990 [Ralstonia sp. R-29]|uniref:hypothetical protein n=1 Tax=Ralstonia sp. R-29 TaxID=3404059 RepID=UPI003CF087E9